MKWRSIVAVAFSVFVLAAAIGWFVSNRNDRDDAVVQRRHAEQALRNARSDLATAKRDLAHAKADGKLVISPVQPITTSVQSLLDLSGQALGEARTTQSLGAADASSVDDYNASVDRANSIVDQYNATLDTIRKQISDALGDVNTHIA
jgi:hypothetical protein